MVVLEDKKIPFGFQVIWSEVKVKFAFIFQSELKTFSLIHTFIIT